LAATDAADRLDRRTNPVRTLWQACSARSNASIWHPHRLSPGWCRPPCKVIGPHVDRDGREAQHDADPEYRRM